MGLLLYVLGIPEPIRSARRDCCRGVAEWIDRGSQTSGERCIVPLDFFAGQRPIANWGSRIRQFLGSSVFRRTTSCVLGLTAYTAVGNYVQDYFHTDILLPAGGQALFGAALSILLVLRTNSAYDRWWEGRKLWGALTNECRNLAVKLKTMADVDPAELALARGWLAAFPPCLRDHLRQGVSDETLSVLPEPIPAGQSHVPGFVSSRLFALVR
ncbi:MAG: hypothetical protein KC910_28405, partial [Candidatus Eremiobacteraeota bacterium]|nr:hypothetical protein [Candidatus Eremiobacteraeota bacterium]